MAWKPLIEEITFKAGASPGGPPLVVKPSHLTVFVGPNNVGKSLALREIEGLLLTPGYQQRVIASVQPRTFESAADLESFLSRMAFERDDEHLRFSVFTQTSGQMAVHNVHLRLIKSEFNNGPWVRQQLARTSVLRLDGTTRLSLMAERQASDFLRPPQNLLTSLFQNDKARRRLSEITWTAFGSHVAIDPTRPPCFGCGCRLAAPTARRRNRA